MKLDIKIADKIADRVRWGYLTAFMVLLVSYILSFYTAQRLLKQAYWLDHTNKVINDLNILQSSVQEAESSFRGFVILKDEKLLDNYNINKPIVDSLFQHLKFRITDDGEQLKKLNTLQTLISNKYSILEKGIADYRQHGYQLSDSIKALGYMGKQSMTDIKNMMKLMQDEETRLLKNRSHRLSSSTSFLKIINIASIILAILLTFYSIITFNKENKAKKQADINAKLFREQLEMRISELAEVNKELIELRSMEKFAVTGRISRTIAHEVRNPLTNINLAAEHLKMEITPSAETDLLLEMITRNGLRINQLISDLLNTTKLTPLDFAIVSVNDIIDASLLLAQDRLELKGIKVKKIYCKNLCNILADTDKLKIAFLNVIVNAIEAMEAGKGILIITTESVNNKCVVVITDNGKGMNKEQLSKLFEPYFTTKENGTGLGLAHTQNIIINHKASISAKSDVGKGTSITVLLN